MDVCAAFYHRVNDDVFETFLRTFRKVSGARLLVYTDNVPKDFQRKWTNDYQVEWIQLKPEQVRDRRCICKLEIIDDCISRLIDGDRLIISDVDMYFLNDPFTAFDKLSFDIGVTLRIHSYKFPVNAGLCFLRINDNSRQVFCRDYKDYIKAYTGNGDWFIDQDYINKLYKDGRAVDVGWEYNFCPNTDVFGIDLAADMIKRAYRSKSVKVLHLKSELKMCIYEGFLDDAVTKYAGGANLSGWNWKKDGMD